MENTLDRINNRLDTVEEKISELKDITIEIFQNETQREKKTREKMNIGGQQKYLKK